MNSSRIISEIFAQGAWSDEEIKNLFFGLSLKNETQQQEFFEEASSWIAEWEVYSEKILSVQTLLNLNYIRGALETPRLQDIFGKKSKKISDETAAPEGPPCSTLVWSSVTVRQSDAAFAGDAVSVPEALRDSRWIIGVAQFATRIKKLIITQSFFLTWKAPPRPNFYVSFRIPVPIGLGIN